MRITETNGFESINKVSSVVSNLGLSSGHRGSQ
jgi:hypothetical protein